jgi:hypothetical protein
MSISTEPGRTARAITPNDSATIGGVRGIFVGTAGNLTVDFTDVSDVVFKNVPSGTLLPIAPLRVKAATTAADIVGIY